MRRDIDLWRGSEINPMRDLFNLSSRLNRVFDDFFTVPSFPNLTEGAVVPACDLEETDSHYLMCVDMPGISKDDINIEVTGNQLRVSGERKSEKREGKERGRVYERSVGRFERTLTLPSDIDADKVEANYRDGVLELAVPKGEAAKGQRVQIGEGKGDLFSKYRNRAIEGESKEAKEPKKVKAA